MHDCFWAKAGKALAARLIAPANRIALNMIPYQCLRTEGGASSCSTQARPYDNNVWVQMAALVRLERDCTLAGLPLLSGTLSLPRPSTFGATRRAAQHRGAGGSPLFSRQERPRPEPEHGEENLLGSVMTAQLKKGNLSGLILCNHGGRWRACPASMFSPQSRGNIERVVSEPSDRSS